MGLLKHAQTAHALRIYLQNYSPISQVRLTDIGKFETRNKFSQVLSLRNNEDVTGYLLDFNHIEPQN